MPNESKTILLIERNSDLLEATGDLLRALGYSVSAHTSVTVAIDALDSGGVTPDLLIADAYTDATSGVEAVDQIRRRVPDLAAVLLSGFGDDPRLRRRVQAGNLAFLATPFTKEELAAEVRRALTGRQATHYTGRPDTAAAIPEPPTRWRRAGWRLAAAFVVVAGIGAALVTFRSRPPALPGFETEQVMRGGTLEALSPIGDLTVAPMELIWEPVAEAHRFRVFLSGADGSILWQAETLEPVAVLPVEVVSRLQPAVSYFWSVEALDAGSNRLAWSARNRFRISPRAGAAA